MVLETLAHNPRGLGITELAVAAGIHRTALHRLLGSLGRHHLVMRDDHRKFRLAFGVLELAAAVESRLQEAALPELSALAEAVGATATLTIADDPECVALLAVEPRRIAVRVSYRTGFRYPLTRGAAGIAILAGRRAVKGERPEVGLARERGYATSHGEVQPGVWGLAAPITPGGRPAQAAVAVTNLVPLDESTIAPRVIAAALAIAGRMGG